MLLWSIMAIYPLLFVWQGLSFSDEGNALTIYSQIFKNPGSVRDTFGTWGASILGGVWMVIFKDLGLLGARLAGAAVSVLTIYFVYQTLKEFINKRVLLWGLLIAFLFSYRFFAVTIIGYNNISILFFAVSIFLLARGIRTSNLLWIFFAASVLALNIFIKLPNIFGLAFILGITLNSCLKNELGKTFLKQHAKQYAAFALGIIFGLFSGYFLLKVLGHDSYYLESLRYLWGSTKINHGPYNNLWLITLKSYARLFYDFAIMFGLLCLGLALYLRAGVYRANFFLQAFLAVSFLGGFYFYYELIGIPISGRILSLLTGLCYAILAAIIFDNKDADKNLRVVAFLMLILFAAIPLGSGAGQVNTVYLIPFALPLLVNKIYNLKKERVPLNLKMSGEEFDKIKYFLCALFILYAVINSMAFTYDDSYNRLRLNSGFNHRLLWGIYTTEAKAQPLSELLEIAPKYIEENDTILVTWIAPLIYYLTETSPYFPHPWTEIYSREQVRNFLNAKNDLPVVIRFDYGKTHPYDDILMEFLEENSYEKKWSNDKYEIYAPQTPMH